MIYWISCVEYTNHLGTVYYIRTDIYEGERDNCTAEEYEAIRGKFSLVKVLAYSPDGETLVIGEP